MTEEEQVEKLKSWWKENGTSIVVGIVIGLAAVVGVRYWFEYQEKRATNASVLYSSYVDALTRKDINKSKQLHSKIRDDYAGTSYAALTAMHEAKQSVESGKLDSAIVLLEWAVKNPGHESLEHLARIRLLRLLISGGKLDKSLNLLDKINEEAFNATYAELRGDIYSSKGDAAQAKKQYQLALASNKLAGKQREFIEMKLGDLPVLDSINTTNDSNKK